MNPVIEARPYAWPFDGQFQPARMALVIIGPQQVLARLDSGRSAAEACRDLLWSARSAGLGVVAVRYGRKPGAPVRSTLIPMEGSPEWAWQPELAPQHEDTVADAPTLDGYHATDLDLNLRQAGIRYLVFCGFGTEAGIYATLVTANDLGYDCLTVSNACAGVDRALHEATVEMIVNLPGIYGAVARTAEVVEALEHTSARSR